MAINVDGIPQELKRLRQWVCWCLEQNEKGNPTKVPYIPNRKPSKDTKASTDDPKAWTSLVYALQSVNRKLHEGIGFVFTEYDQYCGVDFDKCIDPETKIIKDWVIEKLQKLNSYTEYSQSGLGIHVIVKGKIPEHIKAGNKTGRKDTEKGFEIYDQGRYFCTTGNRIDDYPVTIEERQTEIEQICAAIFGKPEPEQKPSQREPSTITLSDQEIIEKASKAKNADKFNRLMSGQWQGEYPSQSEADLALCCELAFWTPDTDQINRLFRQSGLYRDKWDRADYRNDTIQKAIDGTTEHYKPGTQSNHNQQKKTEPSGISNQKPEDKSKNLKVSEFDNEGVPVVEETEAKPSAIVNQKSSEGEPVEYKEDTMEIEPFPTTDQSWFNKYLSLFNGVTEAPDSYHFMGFASAVGIVLNRKVHFRYVHNLYPSLYILLVGRSGRERKDTAMKFVRNLIEQTCKVQILSSLSSYEGLLQAMTKPEVDLIDGIEYNKAICILSEFNALLKKARNDSISNLIPELCGLYDTPNKLSLLTRGNPLKIDNPFFSILAGIQPGILTKEMQSGDIHGGFTGRFLYVRGVAKEPVAIPADINQDSWNEIKGHLKSVNTEWESRSKDRSVKLEWMEESKQLWTEFYNWHFIKKGETSELMATLVERIPEQVLKLALIFSALEGFYKIEDYILADAIKVGKWCMVNTEKLFEDFGQTLREKAENKITNMLKMGEMSRRKLQQNSNIDAETFSHAMLNLISAGLVEEFRNGKKKTVKLTND